jgi:gluconokinase
MLASVRQAIAAAGVAPAACAGLSIGGALHSLLAVDGRGEPLTGVITWADRRAVEQAERLRGTPLGAELYRRTGCPPHGMYAPYKIIWLREERPDIFAQAARYLTAKEYIYKQLSGDYRVDPCLAAGSGLMNTHTLDWDEMALDLTGARLDQLSPVADPLGSRGRLLPDIAAQMDLPAHTPLILGSGDAANSTLGAGALHTWQATCMVGASGALRVIAPAPVLGSRARNWCYAIDQGHWLVGGSTNNGGLALSWLRDALNHALPGQAHLSQLSFQDILNLAAQVEAGAGGVICLPFFAGERSPNWNLKARAAFFGLTLEHDARHLARALLEGVALRLRSLQEMLAEVGVDARQIRASGGFTHSALWLQITADVLNRELVIPVYGETSALGAAFWPMLAAGLYDNLEDLEKSVSLGASCAPDPQSAALYARLYPLFTGLYAALESQFERIAELQDELSC